MAAHQQVVPQPCHLHIVGMMQKFSGCASVQLWGARAFAQIIPDDIGAARELGRAGACEAIAAALNVHLKIASVQYAALYAASKLVRKLACNWQRLKAAGVCPLAVASMRVHAFNSNIRLCGAWLIKNILDLTASDGDATEHVAVKNLLMAARADVVLVQALRNHCRNPGTVCAVLDAVESLGRAWTGAEALAFCTAGGAQAVVAFMEAYDFDIDMQLQSLLTLTTLIDNDVNGSKAVTAQFLAAGATAAVTAALRAIPLAHAEASLALDAVSCLAAHGAAVQLVAAGAAEEVVALHKRILGQICATKATP
eukprot:TRINITY_DN3723_c0_g1_i4.p1 TRINITY_DN3723_c0_g1~~TRINITY_DN3723_c0_g1_i4.p1  ORF type:complete len:311 (-),score=60.58 TRINITY_DN3723_c0_g1_i4:585-1517(-)